MRDCVQYAYLFAECDSCRRVLCANHFVRECTDDHQYNLGDAFSRMQLYQGKMERFIEWRREHPSDDINTYLHVDEPVHPLAADELELSQVLLRREFALRGYSFVDPQPAPTRAVPIPETLPDLGVILSRVAHEDVNIDRIGSHRLTSRASDLARADVLEFIAAMQDRDQIAFPLQYEYLCWFIICRIRDLYHTRYWRMAKDWEDISDDD